MSRITDAYKAKLRTPEEAVKCVKDGDWIDYFTNLGFPYLLDKALAKRRDELHGVNIRGNLMFGPLEVVECDPSREHFWYNSWHLSGYERKLCDRGLCSFIPMLFRNLTWYYREFLDVNVAMISVTPMDSHGFFNLSCATGCAKGIIDKADIVIVEVNEKLPRLRGGFGNVVHIDEVDYVVEGEHPALPQIPLTAATEEENRIAEHLLPFIKDGSTLQLGIGSLPNVVGAKLAESDLKDLGMHTELCGDAYYVLHESGKLTNKRLSIHNGQGMTGVLFGSQTLYDWVDDNPEVVAAPLEYVNGLETLGQIKDLISINNCIAVDLNGQISSESSGPRQISGTGGQLDFVTGSVMAPNGKAFICLTSTFKDRQGQLHSRIVSDFNGDIITVPRTQAYYIVTEFGAVNLAGRSLWERAERLISVAHPDFRDELIKKAEERHIWRRSNKI